MHAPAGAAVFLFVGHIGEAADDETVGRDLSAAADGIGMPEGFADRVVVPRRAVVVAAQAGDACDALVVCDAEERTVRLGTAYGEETVETVESEFLAAQFRLVIDVAFASGDVVADVVLPQWIGACRVEKVRLAVLVQKIREPRRDFELVVERDAIRLAGSGSV